MKPMTLREAKEVLRSVTMACWWPSRVTGRKVENRGAILREANGFLTYPCSDERRAEVEKAMSVYYVGAAR